MAEQRPQLVKPGQFGVVAAADSRRGVFDAHNEVLLAKGVPIDAVFTGDSITDMWAIDGYFEGTQGILVNRGIGGDRTNFMRRRFEADVLQLHPRLVVMKIGVNNFWDMDIWWDPSLLRRPAEIEDEIVNDITAMVEAAREQHIIVALCSILPTDMPFNSNTPVRNQAITRVNERLKQLADGSEVIYVDYHSHLVSGDGLTLRPGLADDGLHPHVVGYDIMADVLLKTLDEASVTVLKRRSPSMSARASTEDDRAI
jgi:lysophospholipase L1-like esterase